MNKEVLKKRIAGFKTLDLPQVMSGMIDELDECGPQKMEVVQLENGVPVAAVVVVVAQDVTPYIEALGAVDG
ncbi:hypothetical protein MO867_13410 [Microbulbifer sp. OS29]|uniref:Uncharacterized protein n=1 Tax=Microbulbifer okhotskensis TaxID=2926617 RepID=A0A9X2EQ77_9GAMM|nr:hypothetical protein [Microbulbifer okhotskensis]MCO1335330.1 hypothetical protein [Microbulbifer okhotskensis]